MIFKYIYSIDLITESGQTKKRLFCIPNGLENFVLSGTYKTDCEFLTLWASDRKKELLRYLGKNSGMFSLVCWDTESGKMLAGSDFLKV